MIQVAGWHFTAIKTLLGSFTVQTRKSEFRSSLFYIVNSWSWVICLFVRLFGWLGFFFFVFFLGGGGMQDFVMMLRIWFFFFQVMYPALVKIVTCWHLESLLCWWSFQLVQCIIFFLHLQHCLRILNPLTPKWLASNFSIQYDPWITHYVQRNRGNDH